jgi:ligand-binding SRPBCC domain-containing protein
MTVSITRRRSGYLLRTALRLPLPRSEVFSFFSDAANLEAITPPSLRFRILTPLPIAMEPGAQIDYRLRIRGLPVRWRSEIPVWEPPVRFVDKQRRGPYRWWRHEHLFYAQGDETLVLDRVRYGVRGGCAVNRIFVAPELAQIFAFRRQKLVELLTS